MAEYIDREKIFPNGVFFVNADNPSASVDELIDRICGLPVADVVEVRHGKWRKRKNWRLYVCSECSHENDNPYRYCPNCGAKMDGKENDER